MPDRSNSTGIVLFGTLRDPKLLEIVVGRVAHMQPVTLAGHTTFVAQNALYPLLLEDPDGRANGILLEDLSADEIERLDYYEAPYGYTRVPMEIAGHLRDVYRPTHATVVPDGMWSLRKWQSQIGAMTREAAIEIMSLYGQLSPEQLLPRLGPIRARAQARVNAAAEMPVCNLRNGRGRADVALEAQRQPYSNFFTVEEISVRVPRFNGGEHQLDRAVYTMADAVILLPYDPVRDVVLLIEQFRPGPYLRGDKTPWCLEAIAGRIDGGETPEDAVHREAQEEAGVSLKSLIALSKYYPSPGGTNEYLFCFAGIADLPDSLAGVGGLESEAEDIRSMVVPFKALMQAVETGEVQNGPLLTCALQLSRLRDDLRKAATPA